MTANEDKVVSRSLAVIEKVNTSALVGVPQRKKKNGFHFLLFLALNRTESRRNDVLHQNFNSLKEQVLRRRALNEVEW